MAEVQVQASKPVASKAASSSKTVKNDETRVSNNSSNVSLTDSLAQRPVRPQTTTGAKETQAISKEVLQILREMNSHVTTQGTRLERQEEKLEMLFTQFNEYFAEPEGYDESNSCEEVQSYDDGESVPLTEKDKSGVFKSLVDKFQQCDTVDAEVNTDLAHFVNTSFRSGLPDDKLCEMLKDIHRPQNCDSLVKTRVNQGIWRLLKMNSQTDDLRMQSIQELLVKATSCVVKVADKCAEKFDAEDVDWISHAIALLGHMNKMINIKRKETHKPDLDSKYHYLASSSLPYTEFLYGDDNDVNKNVKEINDLNKLGKSSGRGGYSRRGYQRGSFRGRFQPYQRGAFRGRGFGQSNRGRQETQTSKNQKMVPKK